MAHVALGVANSGSTGTTAQDFRLMLGAIYQNAGIISGLEVTGGTSMAYSVASGVAVCTRGASDGKTLAYWPGGSVATTANSGGNPRIDAVYIIAHDLSHGDADNFVTVGVAQGTAAAVPTAPTIPTYATLLAQMLVPAGATTTANAHQSASVGYAIPYGASLGILDTYLDTWDGREDPSLKVDNTNHSASIFLPTDRLVELEWARTMSSCDAGNPGSVLVKFDVDGVTRYVEEVGTDSFWQTRRVTWVTRLDAGNHVIRFHNVGNSGGSIWYHYAPPDGGVAFCNGLTCQIIDRGVVR